MTRLGVLAALTVAALALLSGCGDTLDHGRVTGKEHQPAYTNVMLIPIFTGETCFEVNNVEDCTPHYTLFPYEMYHPEQWVLDLKACDPGKKCKTGHAYLDEGTWESVKVGSYWQKHPGDGKPNPAIRLKRA